MRGGACAALGRHVHPGEPTRRPAARAQVRRVVEDCINNVHPIYHIKTLMVKRELAKDPALASESWDRFLPHFKHRNVPRQKPHKVGVRPFTSRGSARHLRSSCASPRCPLQRLLVARPGERRVAAGLPAGPHTRTQRVQHGGVCHAQVRAKKTYTPFPPPQQPSKVDLQLESGEYFLSRDDKAAAAAASKRAAQAAKTQERKRDRAAAFVAPVVRGWARRERVRPAWQISAAAFA